MVSLLPASSPAKTYEVFFETDELVLPPFCSMSFEASLLVIVGSVSVSTKVLPSKKPPVFSAERVSFSDRVI